MGERGYSRLSVPPPLALCTQGSRDLIARTLPDKPRRRTLINRHLIDRTHARLRDVELHRFYATAIKKCVSKERARLQIEKSCTSRVKKIKIL